MFRYQIIIEYDGTNFIGWQSQTNGKSIQKEIEKILSKILKEEIRIYGSGRTDAGVHAKNQSAHFDYENNIFNKYKFISSLNYFLNKKDISIKKIIKKNLKFHARFSAKEREYEYVILNRNALPVLDKNKVWHLRSKLDINLLKKASKKLVGTHNFNAFRSSNCQASSPVRTLKKIKITKKNEKILFALNSQSFLKNQVRSIIGCLKYIGEKKWKIKDLEKVLKSKNRKFCAPPAPAQGLYLSKIIY
jgi:tRNA pseudouridine38-40 synthase|tara:strand:- start:2257 stop:2997 length:741 start_codon:yes stop_codon:yes gene_type:complete